MNNETIISGLDIGSEHIRCLVARAEGARFQVLGIGEYSSEGISAGQISDAERAQKSISTAISRAEHELGLKIETLVVSINRCRNQSENRRVVLPLTGEPIKPTDVIQLINEARSSVDLAEGRHLLHLSPSSFALEDGQPIKNPLGLHARQLEMRYTLVTADEAPIKTIKAILNDCYVSNHHLCLGAFAAGLAALEPEEREIGSILIDLGAETTNVAVFRNDALVCSGGFPMGSKQINTDIARGLGVSRETARILKLRHGNAIPTSSDNRDMVDYYLLGDNPDQTPKQLIPRASLTSIIAPRVEEILESAGQTLRGFGFNQFRSWRIVLTGGGANLAGIGQLATRLFETHVRVGQPLGIDGLTSSLSGPQGVTLVGLLYFGRDLLREANITSINNYRNKSSHLFANIFDLFKKKN